MVTPPKVKLSKKPTYIQTVKFDLNNSPTTTFQLETTPSKYVVKAKNFQVSNIFQGSKKPNTSLKQFSIGFRVSLSTNYQVPIWVFSFIFILLATASWQLLRQENRSLKKIISLEQLGFTYLCIFMIELWFKTFKKVIIIISYPCTPA